jgi:hypothetical protein
MPAAIGVIEMAKATNKFEIGQQVRYKEEDATCGIVAMAKGWVTVMRQDGTEFKCRADKLTLWVGGPVPIQLGDGLVASERHGAVVASVDAEHPPHVTEEAEGVNFSDLDPEVLAAAMAEDEADEAEEEDESGNPMANTIKKYKSRYRKMTTTCGKSSVNNGDSVAKLLAPLDHDDVMRLADEFCELGGGFCNSKYILLNNGQKRMNSGNRIRARIKKNPEQIQTLGEIMVAFRMMPEPAVEESEEAEESVLTPEDLAAATKADEEHAEAAEATEAA